MTRLSFSLIPCLLLLFCSAALSQPEPAVQPGSDGARHPSTKLLEEYAYPKVVVEKMESEAEDMSENAQDKKYSKFRMRQLEIKERAVFVLCLVAILAHWLVTRSLRGTRVDTTNQLVTATGLIYVIFGTILLVLLALTDQQLTAATGILGAIAGYLFGSSPRGAGRETTSADGTADAISNVLRNFGPAMPVGAKPPAQVKGIDAAPEGG